ncbi:MAG: DMT family transporter [Rickettsiales bacterium]|nr:DMT family transporter [Rickettsiales bacterium]
MSFFKNLSHNSQGIYYNIAACFLASVLISIVRFLSAEFHIFFIVMMRNFFALLFFAPQITANYKGVFHTKKIKLHLFRGLNGLASMFIWFHVISAMPLSEAVSISFIIPILTTIAAVVFLKEKVSSHTWIASFIGFIGILIILRPGFKEFNPAYIYSFISVILWIMSNLIIKTMTKTEKPQTIVAYMSLIMLFASIPFALPYVKAISFESVLWFAALGLVSNLLHICISHSYAKADLSYVQPFDFTRLIFTAIISYFAFGEIIDGWVVAGSLVILCGVIIVMPRRKTKTNKAIFKTPMA